MTLGIVGISEMQKCGLKYVMHILSRPAQRCGLRHPLKRLVRLSFFCSLSISTHIVQPVLYTRNNL
jgi:hypothetical protein